MPATSSITTSEQPSTDSSSAATDNTTEEDTTTSDGESITSIASDRQLRPQVPISYNETVLNHLHGKPQKELSAMFSSHFQLTALQKTQIAKTQMKKMDI